MKTKALPLIVVFATIAAVVLLALYQLEPNAVTFQQITQQAFLGTLTWMFTVALFLERAVEVIVIVLRDDGAGALQGKVDAEQARLGESKRVNATVAVNLDALQLAQADLTRYRADTKELALCLSFVLGIVVSLAGVRAFASIVSNVPVSNWLFPSADVIVTGAVLAGGSEGIHQMTNVLSNFLESLKNKVKP